MRIPNDSGDNRFFVQPTDPDRVHRLAMVALGIAAATALSLAALLTMLADDAARDALWSSRPAVSQGG